MPFDGEAFGREIVSATKAHIDAVVAPLFSRLDAFEKRFTELPVPRDGKDADPKQVASIVTADLENVVSALIKSEAERILGSWEKPQDGKSVTTDELMPIIEDRIQRAVLAIPAPKDGKDGIGLAGAMVDRSGNLIITASDGTTKELGRVVGADGRDGINGKDGTPGERGIDGVNGKDGVDGLNGKDGRDGKDGADGVNGKDGASGLDGKDGADGLNGKDGAAGLNGKDGADGLNGKDGAAGLNGKDGRDGVDVADLLVIENGDVVATFTDGRSKVLGPFRGKDGAPGRDGKDGADADISEIEHLIADRVAKIQPPEIERDAHRALIARMIDEAVARQSNELDEFAPDDVAANVSLAVKMVAERPAVHSQEPVAKTQPAINISLSDNRDPPTVNMAAPVVNVGQPNVIIEAKRSKEVTKVTGYDTNGRITSFEKTEIDE